MNIWEQISSHLCVRISLKVNLLDYSICSFLTLQDNVKLSFQVVLSVFKHTSRIYVSPYQCLL